MYTKITEGRIRYRCDFVCNWSAVMCYFADFPAVFTSVPARVLLPVCSNYKTVGILYALIFTSVRLYGRKTRR